MTADEAEALFLSGLPGPAAELGLGTVVDRGPAQGARRAADGAALAGLAAGRAVPPRCGRLVPGERAGPLPRGPRRGGLGGAARPHRVRARRRRRSSRVIGPLGLVLKGGVWYLVATVDEPDPHVPRLARGRAPSCSPSARERPAGLRPRRLLGGVERGLRARDAAHHGRRPAAADRLDRLRTSVGLRDASRPPSRSTSRTRTGSGSASS